MMKQISKKIVKRINRNNFQFSTQKNNQQKNTQKINEQSIGNYKGIVVNMRKDANIAKKQRSQHTALHKYNKKLTDHLIELTLYMKHNQWKSQIIYAILNYHKLGFKIVSDYAFLDSSSYMLQLRNLKQQQRWPTIRAIIGLKPRIIITGAEQIQKFFVQNLYFSQSYLKSSVQTDLVKKHIDQNILPYMQSLMWHPSLTYQTTLHTDIYYHQAEQKNYMLVGIVARNFAAVTKAVTKNIIKIFKQKQRYLQSKQKLTNQLKKLSELYLSKSQFFGGESPNFLDFYLYSNFKTKWDSKYFKNYLQEQISVEFKRWLFRMGWNCEYVKDRVTLL